MSPFEAALVVLRQRIIRSGYGWADDEALHALLHDGDLFGAAMCQAVHEALWTAVRAGMDEETLTASLMGGLTSCLTWFALMARAGDDEARKDAHCDVYWAHQARHVERWRGADFGLARRVSPEGHLRIALYQAKVVPCGGMANLLRSVRPEKRSAADRSLKDLLNSQPSDYLPSDSIHQIHKLFRTRNLGLTETGCDLMAPDLKEWVRYVFWFKPNVDNEPVSSPNVRDVPSLLREIRTNRRKPRDARFRPGDFLVSPFPNEVTDEAGGDFISLAAGDGANDLLVAPETARGLMGELANIGIPDFLIADEVGGDAGEYFWREVFGLTNLNVTFKAGTSDIDTRPTSVPSPTPSGPLGKPS